MRVLISREGVHEKFDSTFFEKDSIKWDERAPLIWNFNVQTGGYYGYAENFIRHNNGHISAELVVVDEHKENIEQNKESIGATIYARELASRMKDGMRIISSCKIYAVSFVIAGVSIDGKELHGGVPWSLKTPVGV